MSEEFDAYVIIGVCDDTGNVTIFTNDNDSAWHYSLESCKVKINNNLSKADRFFICKFVKGYIVTEDEELCHQPE